MRNAKGRNKERRTGGRILVVSYNFYDLDMCKLQLIAKNTESIHEYLLKVGVVLLTLCIHSSDAFIKVRDQSTCCI